MLRASDILVREFRPGDEAAFARLNEAWIEKFFYLEDKDRATLRNPQKYILDRGDISSWRHSETQLSVVWRWLRSMLIRMKSQKWSLPRATNVGGSAESL